MKTNDILSMFQSNNYKLETVLSKKKFSGDVKNLLLSMLYKISTSYNDYANIKINVENKNQYIENIISIINKCNKIELAKPNTEEGEKLIENHELCKVDTISNSIQVFPSERAMLFALFKMNDTKMYLDEKYNILRIALPELLNEGRDINNIEIIRDFNAWSWNTLPSEISNIDCNLIYQNLLILLGFEFLDTWMKQGYQKELLAKLEDKLKSEYNSKEIEKLLNLIYKIAIIICSQRNSNEKSRLEDEKSWDEKELARLNDKQNLVTELTKNKKEKAKEIKKIDKILNDKILLAKEFEKRNANLSEYKKIFSVENLEGILKKERKKALNDIEEANELLDAKKYIKRKEKLENDVDLLKEIKNDRNKEKYKINLQKIFIKCLEEKIDKIEEVEQKKKLLQFLYILRYYNFIVYDEGRFIKDVEPLQDEIQELIEKVISKLYELKAINSITKDLKTDIKIIKPILETRIMNLANVNVQIEKNDTNIEVEIYDGDILEIRFELKNTEGIEIKNKKKVKVFAK